MKTEIIIMSFSDGVSITKKYKLRKYEKEYQFVVKNGRYNYTGEYLYKKNGELIKGRIISTRNIQGVDEIVPTPPPPKWS